MESPILSRIYGLIEQLKTLKNSKQQLLLNNAEPGLREMQLSQDVLLVAYVRDIDLCIDLLQRTIKTLQTMQETATRFTVPPQSPAPGFI